MTCKNNIYVLYKMNTQTIVMNRGNVMPSTNNTKYVYRFPKPFKSDSHEIALASLNMYYSWPNIQANYNNNVFSYLWWDHLGILNARQDILIPDGNYSISTLSDFVNSQMYLRGHYLKNSNTQKNVYFVNFIENPTYYGCQINFTSMYAKNSVDATTYINENPPTQVYNSNNVLVWKGWDYPILKQFPQVIMDTKYEMMTFLGYKVGYYPPSNTLVSTTFETLSQNTPNT